MKLVLSHLLAIAVGAVLTLLLFTKDMDKLQHDNKVMAHEWSLTQQKKADLMVKGMSEAQADDFIMQGCAEYYNMEVE